MVTDEAIKNAVCGGSEYEADFADEVIEALVDVHGDEDYSESTWLEPEGDEWVENIMPHILYDGFVDDEFSDVPPVIVVVDLGHLEFLKKKIPLVHALREADEDLAGVSFWDYSPQWYKFNIYDSDYEFFETLDGSMIILDELPEELKQLESQYDPEVPIIGFRSNFPKYPSGARLRTKSPLNAISRTRRFKSTPARWISTSWTRFRGSRGPKGWRNNMEKLFAYAFINLGSEQGGRR